MRLIAGSGGALAAILSGGGCGGARWRESRARAGETERQRGRVKSGAPRAQQMKAGAWKRRQAVAAARWASSVHGRHAAVAPWRGQDTTRENGAAQRWGRPDAALGWAERGARERRALRQVGPALAVGREGRRRPVKGEKHFSIFDFQGNFK